MIFQLQVLTSNLAKDFVCKLLVIDPKVRWTAEQALNHPFITGNCRGHAIHRPPNPLMQNNHMNTSYEQLKNLKVPALIPKRNPTQVRPIAQVRQVHHRKSDVRHYLHTNVNPTHNGTNIEPVADFVVGIDDDSMGSNDSTLTAVGANQFTTDAPKTQFSVKVNRIASWFRSATIVDTKPRK
jgi:serine/threonine protein kinase